LEETAEPTPQSTAQSTADSTPQPTPEAAPQSPWDSAAQPTSEPVPGRASEPAQQADPAAITEPPVPRAPAAFDPSAFRPLRIDEDYDAVDDTSTVPPPWSPAPPQSAVPGPPAGLPSHAGPPTARPLPKPREEGPVDPAVYPIPPSYAEPPGPATFEPDVPTWAHRTPSPQPRTNGLTTFADYTIDPMSLRRRVTIRAGASALSVDESKLVLRSWWKRTEIPWSEVDGFEPRFDGAGTANGSGRLVALTRSGPRDLPATKRDLADLRYLAALLDAYRQRATIAANR
jgi:hypothetical protein